MNKGTYIIAGVAVVVSAVAFLVYAQFFKADPVERQEVISKISVVGGASGITADASVTEFLLVLNRLKKIKVDTTLFEDPVFKSLKDFSVKLKTEPKGRPNPFAPLAEQSTPASAASSPGLSGGSAKAQ